MDIKDLKFSAEEIDSLLNKIKNLDLSNIEANANIDLAIGQVETVENIENASASIVRNGDSYKLNLSIPKGEKGDKGSNGGTPSFSIGTVSTGSTPQVIMTGDFPNYILNFVLPIVTDSSLSTESTNPIQNKIVAEALNNVNSQLNTIEQDKVESNYLFKRKIIGEFPLRFEDYNQIVSDEKNPIYPQSFAIDNKTNELFVLYSPESTVVNGKRWIVVYDIETKKYKSCFQAGNAGGEGIVIKYENTERYLYVKTTESNLGKFLINTLPNNKSTLTPISEYNVGLHWQFCYGDGYWYIEQSGAILGRYARRNIIAKYDDNFNKIGEIYIDSANIGFFNSSYYDYVSKRQGFTIHNGNFIFGMGGCYKTGTPNIPFSNYGLRILNMKGENIQSAIIKSDKFIELLQLENIPCTRIENEGVYSINDKLYSICMTLGLNDNQTDESGIIIFEEMANSDYIDCSNISASDITFNKEAYENSNFPRSSDGQLYNPITGELIDTIDKMLDFMINVDLRSTSFYSSSSTLQWFNSDIIPSASLIKIENCNNSTFNIEIKGDKDIKRYWVFGTSGSRTVKQVINDYETDWINIDLAEGISAYNDSTIPQYRRSGSVVFIRGGVKGITQQNQLIGTIPSDEFAPNGQSHQYVAPISTTGTSTRVGRYSITVNGEIRLYNNSDGNYSASDWYCITTTYII